MTRNRRLWLTLAALVAAFVGAGLLVFQDSSTGSLSASDAAVPLVPSPAMTPPYLVPPATPTPSGSPEAAAKPSAKPTSGRSADPASTTSPAPAGTSGQSVPAPVGTAPSATPESPRLKAPGRGRRGGANAAEKPPPPAPTRTATPTTEAPVPAVSPSPVETLAQPDLTFTWTDLDADSCPDQFRAGVTVTIGGGDAVNARLLWADTVTGDTGQVPLDHQGDGFTGVAGGIPTETSVLLSVQATGLDGQVVDSEPLEVTHHCDR